MALLNRVLLEQNFFKEAHSVLLCFTMRPFKSRQPEHSTLICAARKSLGLRGFTCTAPDHKQLASCECGLRMVREWGMFFLISLFSCGNLTSLLPSGRHWCKTLLPFSAESRQRNSRLSKCVSFILRPFTSLLTLRKAPSLLVKIEWSNLQWGCFPASVFR